MKLLKEAIVYHPILNKTNITLYLGDKHCLPTLSVIFGLSLLARVHGTIVLFKDMLGLSTCVGKCPVTKCLKNGENLFSGLCVSESTGSLLPEGPNNVAVKPKQCCLNSRSLSECSGDSEDSFIVFHGSPGSQNISWDENDNGESSSDEDETHIVQGSDGESYKIDSDGEGGNDDDITEDACDGFSQRLKEVNQCWQLENQPLALKREPDVMGKQVCFAPPETLQTVYPIIAWDFAYRASRVGPWEEMARDRARFRTRIERTEHILAPVLSSAHRKRILERREKAAHSCN